MLQNSEQDASGVLLSTLAEWRWVDADSPPESVWFSPDESVFVVMNGETGVQAWLHCMTKATGDEANDLANHLSKLAGRLPSTGWTSLVDAGLDDGWAFYLTPVENGSLLTEHLRSLRSGEAEQMLLRTAIQTLRAVRASCKTRECRLRAQIQGALIRTLPDSAEPEVIFTSLAPVPKSQSWEDASIKGLRKVLETVFGEQGLPSSLKTAISATMRLPLEERLAAFEIALLKELGMVTSPKTNNGTATGTAAPPPSSHPDPSASSSPQVDNPIAPITSSTGSTAYSGGVPTPLSNPLKWVLGKTPRRPKAALSISRTDLLLWLAAGLSLVIAGIVLVEPAPMRKLLVTEVTDTLASSDSMWTSQLPDSGPSLIKSAPKSLEIPSGPPPSLAQAEAAFRSTLESPGAKQSLLVSAFKLLRLSPDHTEARLAIEGLLRERVKRLLTGIGLTSLAYEDDIAANWDELAQLGFADAALLAASELLETNPSEASRRALGLAKDGRASSLVFLGQLYARGVGLDRDFKQALSLFREAAKQNDSGALYLVAECLYQGRGTTKDIKASVVHLQKAADGSDPRAMDLLANCYYKGEGSLKRNAVVAAKWFRAAADLGNTKSLTNLAVLELKGDLPGTGPKEAVQLLTRSAEAGHPYGTCLLAYCYEEGQGVEKDLSNARTFYRKAAKLGQPDAIEWCSKNDTEKSPT